MATTSSLPQQAMNNQIMLVSTAVAVVGLTMHYRRIYRTVSTLAHRAYLNLAVLSRTSPLPPPPSKQGTGSGTVTQLYIHPGKCPVLLRE